MPPKKDIIVNIQDEEHLLNYINSDNKKIVVVDIHPGWCGKCEMMFPTYKSLLTSIDDFEKRVDILMVDIEKIATYKNDKFRTQLSKLSLQIAIARANLRKIVDEVNGADIPAVSDRIYKYLPMVY